MAVQEQLYMAADLLALSGDGKRCELVKGRLIQLSPTGDIHGRLTNEIGYLLTAFARQHDLGQVYGAATGFRLATNPDTVRGVDAAFIAKSRLTTATEEYSSVIPDLIVEVVSPSNTKTEMHEKIEEYFRAGSRLVWVLYPKSRVIYIYRSGSDVTILHGADMLDGGAVLPGFSVKVGDIFSVLDKR